MDEMSFPFMRLPTELQVEIVGYVRGYSNLKSLCLVSKHVLDIATPCLYYVVEIIHRHISIKKKVKSLLIKPANLQLVRVLKTDEMNKTESMLIGQLLPRLSKDSLERIYYTSSDFDMFPMPYQIEFLWRNQKNIQNLRLITYMVPWLNKFSKKRLQPRGDRRRSAILKSFTDLELEGDLEEVQYSTIRNMLWPLQNLDLTVLQKLTLSSEFIDSTIFSTLNNLFDAGCFVNLTELHFRYIRNLFQTLTLTRMPLLNWLTMTDCDFQGPDPPLVLEDDIRLLFLSCKTSYSVKKLIPLLAQAKGLEVLTWDCEPKSLAFDEIDEDLIRAIMTHEDTLRELDLFDKSVPLGLNLEAMLWDSVRLAMIWESLGMVKAEWQ